MFAPLAPGDGVVLCDTDFREYDLAPDALQGSVFRMLRQGQRVIFDVDDIDVPVFLAGAWQDEPWDGDVVAKVADKIFAFLGSGASVGVKCGANREEADEWLLQYPDHAHVMPYIGRSGWNTLDLGGAIPDVEVLEAVDTSYATVVAKLPRSRRPAAGG